MTDHVPGKRTTDHVALEDIADAAESLLSPADAARVADHLQHCAECTRLSQKLSDATAALGDLPAPPMPGEVAERLVEVVRAESRRRASGAAEAEEAAGLAEAVKQTDLGSFRHNPFIAKDKVSVPGHLVGRHRPDRPRSDE